MEDASELFPHHDRTTPRQFLTLGGTMSIVVQSMKAFGLEPDYSGKVRDIFDLKDKLLIVTSDRISAYDSILPDPIPGKGILLTQMTLGWYDYLAGDLETHFISSDPDDFPAPFTGRKELRGRSMLVKKAERFDIECIVRGYLAGSGWREYRTQGTVCGIKLPVGLKESSRLPEPIFTPSTKADSGHDENISFETMCGIVPREYSERLRDMSLTIYSRAHEYAKERGIILADTKFEFGLLDDKIILIDEMLSPDSSRFWPLDEFEPGRTQHSFDKQYVRDYLDEIGWDHNPPAPTLPKDVTERTRKRYEEACVSLFPKINLERFA
jgi:phosphoribosylaminoimidazole-succinocarboxamide synthase